MSAIIAYDNLADICALSSSSSLVPGFPLAALQTRQLSTVCRSTSSDAGHRTLTVVVTRAGGFDPTERYLVGFFGVRPGAAYVSEVSYTPDGGATWTAIPFSLAGFFFTYGRALAVLNPPIPPAGPWDALRITLKSVDTADAHIDAGRLWLSRFIDFPTGCDATWSLGLNDPGRLDMSAGQQAYESRRERARLLRMGFSAVPTPQAYACSDDGMTPWVDNMTYSGIYPCLYGLLESVGGTGELVAMPRVEGDVFVDRACIYGHLAQPFEIRHRAGQYYETELVVVEER